MPFLFLSIASQITDNRSMEEMIYQLKTIGMSDEFCADIRRNYDGDEEGLALLVLYCRAMYDDRREYV